MNAENREKAFAKPKQGCPLKKLMIPEGEVIMMIEPINDAIML